MGRRKLSSMQNIVVPEYAAAIADEIAVGQEIAKRCNTSGVVQAFMARMGVIQRINFTNLLSSIRHR